jgi:hypothetical protein
MGIGTFIVGVTILSNVEHIYRQVGTLYDPSIFAAFAVSVGIVACLAFAMDAFEDWRKLSSWVNGGALLAAYFAGVAYEITTTFDRTSTARDTFMERTWNKDTQYAESQKLLIKVSNMAARTCGEANWQKVDPKKASRACADIRQEVEIAEEKLETRRGELDPLGKRVAWLSMGYMDVKTAGMVQPMFLPIALFLMGSFFVAYGVKGKMVPAEFDTALTGMAAKEDKASRFIAAYYQQHSNLPSVADVCRTAKVSEPTARKYLRSYRHQEG